MDRAFPGAYSILLSALYLPVIVMLAGLILRGVAFEFRNKTERLRWLWDWSFIGGSFVASFTQGLTVGALVEGLPIANGQYVGGNFGWFTPFATLCGLGRRSVRLSHIAALRADQFQRVQRKSRPNRRSLLAVAIREVRSS
jgi:cytochrome bd-type quinol oxidase subunit 2